MNKDVWLKNPSEWNEEQAHFWGLLFSDLSVAYGGYLSSFGAGLSQYLDKNTVYLTCGNKDSIITKIQDHAFSDEIPIHEDHPIRIFQIKCGKFCGLVPKVDLTKCKFDGVNGSEHFNIFVPLQEGFVTHLLANGLLRDTKPDTRGNFKVFQKRIPKTFRTDLSNCSKDALIAGILDGDGSVGVLSTCDNCKARSFLISDAIRCKTCGHDMTSKVKSLSCYVSLDSTNTEVMCEELDFILEQGLMGHVFVQATRKRRPDKLDESSFKASLEKQNAKLDGYEVLSERCRVIIKRHILESIQPSYHEAPDVYTSVSFKLSPGVRTNAQKKDWYGCVDLRPNNWPKLFSYSKYMCIQKKRVILRSVIKNVNDKVSRRKQNAE